MRFTDGTEEIHKSRGSCGWKPDSMQLHAFIVRLLLVAILFHAEIAPHLQDDFTLNLVQMFIFLRRWIFRNFNDQALWSSSLRYCNQKHWVSFPMASAAHSFYPSAPLYPSICRSVVIPFFLPCQWLAGRCLVLPWTPRLSVSSWTRHGRVTPGCARTTALWDRAVQRQVAEHKSNLHPIFISCRPCFTVSPQAFFYFFKFLPSSSHQ